MSFKIVPSEEGISAEEALLAFNKQYVPINAVHDRLSDIPEDQINKLYGWANGNVESKLFKGAKTFGLTLEGKTQDKAEQLINAYESERLELLNTISELKTNVDTASKAEIDKLTQTVSDLKALNEKLKNDLELISKEKTTIESEFTQKQLEIEINLRLQEAEREFTLIDDKNTRDACTYEKLKYKFTLDENKNERVYGEDGKPILSSKTDGSFAKFNEVLNNIYTNRGAHKKIIGVGALNSERVILEEKKPVGNQQIPK